MLLYYKRNKSNPSHFFTFHKMFISSIITIEIVKTALTLIHKDFSFEKCEHNVKAVFKIFIPYLENIILYWISYE